MSIYIYMFMGILLGAAITVYFYEMSREKHIINSSRFVSKKLKLALDNSSAIIYKKVNELKRDLTEEEKDAIIRDCYTHTMSTEKN